MNCHLTSLTWTFTSDFFTALVCRLESNARWSELNKMLVCPSCLPKCAGTIKKGHEGFLRNYGQGAQFRKAFIIKAVCCTFWQRVDSVLQAANLHFYSWTKFVSLKKWVKNARVPFPLLKWKILTLKIAMSTLASSVGQYKYVHTSYPETHFKFILEKEEYFGLSLVWYSGLLLISDTSFGFNLISKEWSLYTLRDVWGIRNVFLRFSQNLFCFSLCPKFLIVLSCTTVASLLYSLSHLSIGTEWLLSGLSSVWKSSCPSAFPPMSAASDPEHPKGCLLTYLQFCLIFKPPKWPKCDLRALNNGGICGESTGGVPVDTAEDLINASLLCCFVVITAKAAIDYHILNQSFLLFLIRRFRRWHVASVWRNLPQHLPENLCKVLEMSVFTS